MGMIMIIMIIIKINNQIKPCEARSMRLLQCQNDAPGQITYLYFISQLDISISQQFNTQLSNPAHPVAGSNDPFFGSTHTHQRM